MPRAVYRLYAVIEPNIAPGEAADRARDVIAGISASLSMQQLEAAVNRQSRLAARITVEKKVWDEGARAPLLKDAVKVVDLRLRARRWSFAKWRFANVHRQLAEAEKALGNYVEYRLDEELRKDGALNGARIAVTAEMLHSAGFFGGRLSAIGPLLFGAALGMAAMAAAVIYGFDPAAALEQARSAIAPG